MPVGPNNFETVNHELLRWTIAEIDITLLNPIKCNKLVHGDADDYFYKFFLPVHFTVEEQKELIREYISVGWAAVEVRPSKTNSRFSEINLYSNKNSRFINK